MGRLSTKANLTASYLGFFHFHKPSSELGDNVHFKFFLGSLGIHLRFAAVIPKGRLSSKANLTASYLGFFHFHKPSSELGLVEMKKAITNIS